MIAPDIKLRPMKRRPKPTRIPPASLRFSFLANSRIKAPMPMSTGAKNSGFMTSPHSLMETIQAVMVVPILAPMITPTAWDKVRMPAFTKPTTMTVVAELLWIMAVISAPRRIPSIRLLVIYPSIRFIRPPAAF